MGDDDHNVGRLFDALQRQLETHALNTTSQIKSFQDNWVEQDRRASDGRKILYGKVEELGHEVKDVGNQVVGLTKDVNEMKPAVASWVTAQQRAIGATKAVKIIWTAGGTIGGGLLVGVGWLLDHFITIGAHIVK